MGDGSDPAVPPGPVDRVIDLGEKARSVWELGAFVISAGSAILAFISDVGGWAQFFVEVAFLGFAAYIALFVVVIPVIGLLTGAERVTRRETTEQAWIVIGALAAVCGAAFVRFALFADGVSQDLDAIGTTFGVIVGVAILLSPLVVWWYVKGSNRTTL
jgi:hypothetical protein